LKTISKKVLGELDEPNATWSTILQKEGGSSQLKRKRWKLSLVEDGHEMEILENSENNIRHLTPEKLQN
jgi:hypothetical protein